MYTAQPENKLSLAVFKKTVQILGIVGALVFSLQHRAMMYCQVFLKLPLFAGAFPHQNQSFRKL